MGMNKESGRRFPGSVSGILTISLIVWAIGSAATTRGVMKARLEKPANSREWNNSEKDKGVEQLWVPQRESVRLFEDEERIRARIVWLLFGLVGAIIVGGLAALVGAVDAGSSGQSIFEFLKTMTNSLMPLAALVVGYYFGRRSGGGKHMV
jgi:hypothetical protein